jgi:transposase
VTSAGVNHQGPLPVSVPNPEVLEKPLRREGLYSSHLTTWCRQREAGSIQALQPQKRGRRRDPVIQENEQLRRDHDRLARQLQKAEAIIEIQKKISELLGIP